MFSTPRKFLFFRWILWTFIVAQTLHEIRCEFPKAGEYDDSSETASSSENSESEEFAEVGKFSELGFFVGANWNSTDAHDTDRLVKVVKGNRTRPRLFDLNLKGPQINETRLKDVILKNALHLRSIYIHDAPMLHRLPTLPLLPELLTIRVINSGLEEIPDLRNVHGSDKNALLQMIDFEGNQIKKIPSYAFQHVRADHLILDVNQIEEISAYAFKDSEISKLSLKKNFQLTRLDELAFAGVKIIRELDLSQTAITSLPAQGLELLEELSITSTPSLKVIPSIYEFQHLVMANLTHPFHCCAFKFPERHDPARHAKYEKDIVAMRQKCEEKKSQAKASNRNKRHVPATSKTQQLGKDMNKMNRIVNYGWGDIGHIMSSEESDEDVTPKMANWVDIGSHESDGLQKSDPDNNPSDYVPAFPSFPAGTFHDEEAILDDKDKVAYCGNISMRRVTVSCTPEPDALNPCEDVMGWRWLRLCVWLVVAAAVLGNAAVALVLLSNRADLTVPKMLMCHLAFADFATGLYLLMLASVDVASYGEYFNYASDWQHGAGCKIAGFLSVFSGQLSVYALAVITLERWFAITFAIYLDRRIDLKAATKIMIAGWIFALTMAGLPLVGVSDYNSTSICLPVESKNASDVTYQALLFATSATAFAVIVVCYIQIYRSLGTDTRRNSTQSNDRSIAKKMSLLIATDFLCWAPVAFFGVTALAGYPLVDVSHSKVLLVFFYPLNACANPFLYAILTQQYQRDFVFLLARYGLCTKMAQKYKIGYSLPTTNNTHPVPLIPRPTLETSIGKELLPTAPAEATL